MIVIPLLAETEFGLLSAELFVFYKKLIKLINKIKKRLFIYLKKEK